MALNLAKAVLDCLKARHEEKLTARQIAEWIFSTYPSECQEKKSNSQGGYIKTDGDLVQQLVAEIGSRRPSLQKQHPELKTAEGRPRRYPTRRGRTSAIWSQRRSRARTRSRSCECCSLRTASA